MFEIIQTVHQNVKYVAISLPSKLKFHALVEPRLNNQYAVHNFVWINLNIFTLFFFASLRFCRRLWSDDEQLPTETFI